MNRPVPALPLVLSLLAALVTLGLKSLAYALTGSAGLLSDAAESLVNLVAAATAMLSLWYSAKPVDPNHTYGHEKIEYFSSGLEGILILVAAAGIGWYAVERVLTPRVLTEIEIGSLLAATASLVNLAVGVILVRQGRKHNSIVLEANGLHLLTDVWTTFAVLAGLFLVWLTDLPVLDAIVALLLAGNVTWTGFSLMRRSFNGLMDHALPVAEQAVVRGAIEAVLEPGLHYHALRTRQAGARRFVDFHLLVPGDWSVQRAHDLTEVVEEAIRKALPGVEVTVHIEPLEAPASWEDSDLLAHEPKPGERL